jgi:hypothetical protein
VVPAMTVSNPLSRPGRLLRGASEWLGLPPNWVAIPGVVKHRQSRESKSMGYSIIVRTKTNFVALHMQIRNTTCKPVNGLVRSPQVI